jgi:hypothetical protein
MAERRQDGLNLGRNEGMAGLGSSNMRAALV